MTIALATPTPRAHRSQPILRALVLIAMALPLVASIVVHSPVPFDTRVEAAFLWHTLSGSRPPSRKRTARRRRPVPFLPIIGVLYGLYFALPAALGAYNQHYKILLTPTRDYDDAVFVALYGWLALLFGVHRWPASHSQGEGVTHD